MTDKPFCVSPFIKHFINTQGSAEVCCESQRVITEGESITCDWHAPQLTQARHLFNQGVWPKDCAGCRETEREGGRSLRQMINQTNPRAVAQFVNTPTTVPPAPQWYDVRMNNTCNLACLMCDAEYSSLHHSLQGRPTLAAEAQHTESALAMLRSRAPHIRWLQLAGGEPLVMPGVCDLLTELADGGHGDHIEVEITTNLTRIRPQWFDHTLTRFKAVALQCSMDAVGDRAEYVRWPLRWNKWTSNMQWLRDWCSRYDRAMVTVNVTVSAPTVAHLPEVHAWLTQHCITAEYSVVQMPPWLAPNRVSPALLDSVCEWIQHSQPHPDLVHRVLPHLRMTPDHSPETQREQKQGIQYLNQHRPLRWSDAVPELAHWDEEA